ncbi:UNVERIFIED_CONTAM: hypothetical protein K2H54_061320 [Gekko kuhli]
MAAEGPLKELWEEASCSICLEFFRDPVILTECGHNFCRACLTQSWGESEASCPQCRGTVQLKSLRPNQQLANFVEIVQKFRPLEAKGGVCERHQEPLKFFCKEDEALVCVVCGLSQEHKDHEVVPLEEAFQENRAMVAARKGGVCQKHEEPLKLFCKDDEALICVVCDRSKEHRDHETLPLEEASQEYKDQFCSQLEILKKERERIVAAREDVEKESQDLLKQTTGEKQKTLAKFQQLHTFLEEQEKLLLAQMEEVEEEVARKRDEHLARLSEELFSLESLIQELEEKCQQPARDLLQQAIPPFFVTQRSPQGMQSFTGDKMAADNPDSRDEDLPVSRTDLVAAFQTLEKDITAAFAELIKPVMAQLTDSLKGVRSTMQRYEEEEMSENPVTFPLELKWKIWDFCDINHSLEGVMKQLKDNMDSGLHLQKAMAGEGPVNELWEEASCSICLDFFKDPVSIAECGHDFCRACLTRGWGESGTSEPSCPQCRGAALLNSLRPNHKLANFVEIVKKFRLLEGKSAEGKGGVCEKHQEPLKFFYKEDEAPVCVVCGLSQEHRDHEVRRLSKKISEDFLASLCVAQNFTLGCCHLLIGNF